MIDRAERERHTKGQPSDGVPLKIETKFMQRPLLPILQRAQRRKGERNDKPNSRDHAQVFAPAEKPSVSRPCCQDSPMTLATELCEFVVHWPDTAER